jgi:thiamine-phosphate pyrophosphorylase
LLLYYITDRSQFPGDEHARRLRVIETIQSAVRCGVDYVQLREKDLSARELETLGRNAFPKSGNQKFKTVLLMNSRTDIAIASGAQGVHLRSNDVSPIEVRKIWREGAAISAHMIVGRSCHSRSEVARAAQQGADFVVFGSVFEKQGNEAKGLQALHQVCKEKIPVIALGGVTVKNARACIQAGAAGIAGIRLFQDGEMSSTVAALRGLAA